MTEIASTELTADEARTLTAEIRRDLDGLLPKIKRAFEGRADRALGYESWQTYCTAELGDVRVPLGDRPTAVAELRQAGMSQRAIGAALGVSQSTVRDDLAELSTSTQLPDRIVSTDGKERPAARPAIPEDLPASTPGEGRSAGLPSPDAPGDASGGSVVDPVAADQLPAGPDPVAIVAAALDQFVPDPNAGTFAWRKDLHDKLTPIHKFALWIDADDAAEFATADDVETIRQLALSFADLHRRILAARNGNVVQLRAVQ